MLNTTLLKEYAQLTQATYAYFTSAQYRNGIGLQSKLQNESGDPGYGANFTEKEAELFTARYELLHQSDNSESSGFSAALFRDRTSGRLIVSFRGTEPFGMELMNDLLITDSRIGLDGYASPQAIQTFRYVKQILTPAGQAVQYTEQELDGLKAIYLDQADGPINYAARLLQWNFVKINILADTGIDAGQGPGVALLTPGNGIAFTGHSLGGHLAMLASRLLPNVATDVVTLNAPDFFSWAEPILRRFSPGWDNEHIHRMEAAGDGISEIGDLHPGTRILLGQENESGLLAALSTNHDKVNSADGLALAELMGKLDARFADDARIAKTFIDQAAATPGQGYEMLLDGLRRTVLGNGIVPTPFNSGTTPASRNAFYANISDLSGNAAFKALSGKVSIQTSANLDPAQARTDFGVLLALNCLTPFVLQTGDAAAIARLRNVHSDLAQDWDADAALTPEQRRDGQARISDAYLADRAAMLALKLKLAAKDFVSSVANPHAEPGLPGQVFDDRTSGTTIYTGTAAQPLTDKRRFIFGTEGDDRGSSAIVGGNRNDNLYGGAGNDELKGEGGNDYLEGGAGIDTLDGGENNDTLVGGRGDDILRGGAGEDTYVINTGDGNDHIVGEDSGRNFIRYNGRLIAGAFVQDTPGGAYRFLGEGGFSLQFNSPGVLTLDENTSLTFDNYSSAEAFEAAGFGIELIAAPTPLTPGRTIAGDLEPIDTDPSEPGVQTASDELGNLLVSGAAPGRADHLYDSAGADLIQAGGGADRIDASRGGADRIEAGAGRDSVAAGAGDDLLVAGLDNDALFGGAGASFRRKVSRRRTAKGDSGKLLSNHRCIPEGRAR